MESLDEFEDYLKQLDEHVGLTPETYKEVMDAISKERKKLKKNKFQRCFNLTLKNMKNHTWNGPGRAVWEFSSAPQIFRADFSIGDFQSKMHFKTLNEQYAEINSSDWKTDKLTEKYGQDIFGLSPTNLKIYARENWFTSFVEKIKLKLYGRN